VFHSNIAGNLENCTTNPNDHGPEGSELAIKDVTAHGMTDPGAGDYTTTSTATLRREAVEIDASNDVYMTAGLSPADAGGGGAGPADGPFERTWR